MKKAARKDRFMWSEHPIFKQVADCPYSSNKYVMSLPSVG